jgi:hypothetical protein
MRILLNIGREGYIPARGRAVCLWNERYRGVQVAVAAAASDPGLAAVRAPRSDPTSSPTSWSRSTFAEPRHTDP